MPDHAHTLLNPVDDALDIGLLLLNDDKTVFRWNLRFADMVGMAASVGSGRTLEELFPNANLTRLRAAVDAALESGVSGILSHSLHSNIFPLKTRANKKLVYDILVNAVGDVPYRCCVIQIIDVTIAFERERILRDRQNARYDAVVASASDVIITLDVNDVIQVANPAAQKQFGYLSSELVGQPSTILFPGRTLWDVMRRAITEGRDVPQPIEVVGKRKDGSETHLEVSLSRWTSESRVFVTAILRDINDRLGAERARREASRALADLNASLEQRVTERTQQLMQAEEALRQSHKMEAVGQLTGGIAHDFNNLLQGIIGALDRIKKRIADGRINDVERFLDGATASANRAAALTKRLLTFSRRQPVDPRPIEVNTLLATVEELLRRSLGEQVQMKIVPLTDLWRVRCDQNQLENALLNLAINARDAMPEGGVLTISTSNKIIDTRQSVQWDVPAGEYVSIRVGDTGVGMTVDVKARAFDPFYTTKPMGQGTGLGLSMIYGFVRQSNGSVRIESEFGSGTTVEMLFPRFTGKMEDARATLDISDEDHSGRNEVVLVVEDEAVVRFLIVEALNELGYLALEAADGPSGLRIVQSQQRIDLLVTDIGLPGLNGRQLADAALVSRPDLKILFMTGYAEGAAGNSFLQPGMEILAKPFSMDVLTKKIRAMVEGI
jgi:PAS domain S-box-containing protein